MTVCQATGKRCYPTAIAVYTRYTKGRARKLTRAYRCPHCHRWHATSQPKNKQP